MGFLGEVLAHVASPAPTLPACPSLEPSYRAALSPVLCAHKPPRLPGEPYNTTPHTQRPHHSLFLPSPPSQLLELGLLTSRASPSAPRSSIRCCAVLSFMRERGALRQAQVVFRSQEDWSTHTHTNTPRYGTLVRVTSVFLDRGRKLEMFEHV